MVYIVAIAIAFLSIVYMRDSRLMIWPTKPKNEYVPWVAMNMTELEYFKMRYIEVRLEQGQLEQELKEALARADSIE